VKSQGPAALIMAEPFLSDFAAKMAEGVQVSQLSLLLEPFFEKDEGASLMIWAEESPLQRALCLKSLKQIPSGDWFGKQNHFLKFLLKLEPEATLPYLAQVRGLPSGELAELLMQEKYLQKKMKLKGGPLLALLRSLPLVLAESREAKMAALKTLPEDAFVDEDQLLCESLILLAQSGLANESKKLKAGEGLAKKWRELTDNILSGKADDITATCKKIQQEAYASDSRDYTDVAYALLANGDPAIKRLAIYLLPLVVRRRSFGTGKK
jgi:hypothetical protein